MVSAWKDDDDGYPLTILIFFFQKSSIRLCKSPLHSHMPLQCLESNNTPVVPRCATEHVSEMTNNICISLLEKRFIRTPRGQYWCRLVTVADTNNGWLTS
jgi:hypothetical protein